MLSIYYLHNHRKCLPITCYFLSRIKDENKPRITFNVLTDTSSVLSIRKILEEKIGESIKWNVVDFPQGPGTNYMSKISWASSQPTDYAMKLDEDIMFSNFVWDFIIENHERVLNFPDVLLMTPALSIGVPSVEMFKAANLTNKECLELNEILLHTKMVDRWGTTYSQLNKHTIRAKMWDWAEFYSDVAKIPGPCKGVHPVRQSWTAQKHIMDLVLSKPEQFLEPRDYQIEETRHPYLCNSCFVIKSDTWRGIISDKSLYHDAYDEIPVNRYRERHNLKWAFIRNAFGVHGMYGDCVPDACDANENRQSKESWFWEEFEKRVCK